LSTRFADARRRTRLRGTPPLTLPLRYVKMQPARVTSCAHVFTRNPQQPRAMTRRKRKCRAQRQFAALTPMPDVDVPAFVRRAFSAR